MIEKKKDRCSVTDVPVLLPMYLSCYQCVCLVTDLSACRTWRIGSAADVEAVGRLTQVFDSTG